MNHQPRRYSSLLCVLLGFTLSASAADIQIISLDVGTGQGLEDPTPATPVGGNPGSTRGAQALIVFQFAADLWGAVLQSDIPIFNTVSFAPLSCTANSGVLGSAGTTAIYLFNPGPSLPSGAIANTLYHSALADALAGVDIAVSQGDPPGTPDINSRFNGDLGKPGCLEGSGWYFGLDGVTPAGQINFLDVVMHEMAHGLGFSGFGDIETGQLLAGYPDIYSTYVRDNTNGLMWNAMTDAQRIAAALDDGNLVFTGTQVKTEAPLILGPGHALDVSAPGVIVGSYRYLAAQFGPVPTSVNFTGMVVSPTSSALACDAGGNPAPATGVSGMIALVDRGNCGFTEKASNAQAGGALGVIIANNTSGLFSPCCVDSSITIPVLMVEQATGASFAANVPVSVGNLHESGLAGSDASGNVQLYAPSTVNPGSSFSHYDTRLSPNAIMEYAISGDLDGNLTVDLTAALFSDIGWNTNTGNQLLLTCDTGVPTSIAGGVIMGANIFASAQTLAAASPDVATYRAAIQAYVNALATAGYITSGQAASLALCLDDPQTQAQYNEWNGDSIFTNGFDW